MDINDQDIEIVLEENDFRQLLDYVNEDETFGNQETLVNLLLFLFYSENTKKKDWVQDIIYVIDNNIFNESFFAPCVKKYLSNNKYLLNNIKQQVDIMKNNGYIKVYNCCITYNDFNDCLSSLYVWCKEKFETV